MTHHHEAFNHHDHSGHGENSRACRICSESYDQGKNPSFLGICETCGYKILIVLLVIMISTSYIALFGVL
ncbi:hypothetical protein [Methanoregula formicica]|uniref:Uncharacterized protein n=1 Tax=Methanoregula formicica (strain DSM 22288 / NBRC 105244 / SMSP) TaxID=593750 RepID=L0HH19_METFS|nr:hypothetical protein [Methanoregula formicica]AGB03076.1 hypothetical protein Metfor_2066 [Methanoregula formicica SMSP]